MNRAELVEAFASFPERLGGAAYVVEDHPSASGEWGPTEVARHLLAVEREVWESRLARVAAEDDPRWSWTEPGLAEGYEGMPIVVVLDAFVTARAANVATVRGLDEAGWGRSGTHATYGRLDVAGLLRIAIDHDEEHLRGLGGPA